MGWANFCTYFKDIISTKSSNQALWLKPNLDRIPLPIQRFDEPLFPFSKEIIEATNSYIGVYIFDLASYIRTGASGMVALERSIAFAKSDAVTLLHGPFLGQEYAYLTDVSGLNVDSFTVSTTSDVNHYLANPPHTCFLLSSGSLAEGGTLDNNQLRLFQKREELQKLDVIDTEALLTDLTDNYLQVIVDQITQRS